MTRPWAARARPARSRRYQGSRGHGGDGGRPIGPAAGHPRCGRTVRSATRRRRSSARSVRSPRSCGRSGRVTRNGWLSPAARSRNDSISAASCCWRFGGRPRRRCPSGDDACFPLRMRDSSVFLTATKPSPSTVSTVRLRLVAARLMAVRKPRVRWSDSPQATQTPEPQVPSGPQSVSERHGVVPSFAHVP